MRIPALPPPGIVSEDTDYSAPGVWSSGSNVRFYHGKPESVGNETDLQSAALETYDNSRKLFAYKISTTIYLAVSGTTTLYRVRTVDWSRTDITPASGWSGGNYGHSLAMFGDILLACPSNKTIFKSVAGAQAVAIANAPDNVTKMIVTPSRQVVALGCNEEISGTFNGRCIRWCDIEDFDDWTTSSSNNAGEYILPGQESIITACVLGDYILIWTDGSLWLGQYIGQPGQTFVFTRVASVGIVSFNGHAVFGGVAYWVDPNFNFYAYQPGGVPVLIPCQVQPRPNPNISDSTTHCFARLRSGEVWFFYYDPASGAQPNAYVAYCIHESQVAGRPVWFKGVMSAAAVIDDSLLDEDQAVTGDSTCVRINASAGSKLIALDRQDGDGTAISWSIGTSQYYIEEGQRRAMITRYIHDVERQDASITMTVTAKDYPVSASSVSSAQTVASSTTTNKDFRISGRLISYQLAGTDLFRLGKPTFEAVLLGER